MELPKVGIAGFCVVRANSNLDQRHDILVVQDEHAMPRCAAAGDEESQSNQLTAEERHIHFQSSGGSALSVELRSQVRRPRRAGAARGMDVS
jgi:hypothetical protein